MIFCMIFCKCVLYNYKCSTGLFLESRFFKTLLPVYFYTISSVLTLWFLTETRALHGDRNIRDHRSLHRLSMLLSQAVSPHHELFGPRFAKPDPHVCTVRHNTYAVYGETGTSRT